jgi:vitamin B12 transporter
MHLHHHARRVRTGAIATLVTPLAASLAVLFSANTQAADSSGDPIVVTATRQEARSNELLSDVTVITREQIEEAGQTTIEELLAQQPGVEFYANGGPGTSSSIFIRGANGNHTLLLIDGQRIGSATLGSPNFSRLPLAQIERIEILRGPASALYGADAIGGVIQVITKRGEGPARINASAGYGSYGTSDSNIGVAGGSETVSYNLQAGYYNTRGFNSVVNPANPNYNADRDGFNKKSVSGSLSVRPASGHEIGLNFLSTTGTNGYDYYSTWPTSRPASGNWRSEQEVSSFSLYSRDQFAADWTSTLRVGHSIDDQTNRSDGRVFSIFRTEQDQASWQNDIQLPLGKALVAAEYLKQQISGTDTYTLQERSIKSLLAGWKGALGDHRLQTNVRHDDNSQFGGKTTAFAAYGYQLSADWRAHASYGTAFKAPTFNDLYYPDFGNANLKPESARNAETSLNWEKSGQRFSATYFRNKVSDLIVWAPPSYLPANVSKATLSGTSLSYSGSIGAFSGGVAVDLQRARDDLTGRRLVRRADQQVKTHLSYTSGQVKIGGEWQLVGDRYDDPDNKQRLGGYGLVNLFAERRLDSEWTLFARANNIFDKQYELARDSATPDTRVFATAGASVFVGVRYQQK